MLLTQLNISEPETEITYPIVPCLGYDSERRLDLSKVRKQKDGE